MRLRLYLMRKRKMVKEEKDYSMLIKAIREQLGLSQEDLARKIGVSYATVNRWENAQTTPSKLAKAQLEAFCGKMIEAGKLNIQKFWPACQADR